MKTGILTLTAVLSYGILSSPAMAEETIAKNIVRQFKCEGTYSQTAHDQAKAITVNMTDYSLTNEADPSYLEYVSAVELAAGFVPQAAKTSWTESRAEDIEGMRDDNPEGRQGWGGKAFYASVLKGDPEMPDEAFVFVTLAAKEQQGQAVRDYQFAGVKLVKAPEGSTPEYTQELLAEGVMTCKQL